LDQANIDTSRAVDDDRTTKFVFQSKMPRKDLLDQIVLGKNRREFLGILD